ncbi:GntR family phosphonate transport system transcriptional regulator [Methylobacterium sp. PvP062]|jgi:GntR family transcriptional regulator, phosphonate transport system regulatory protein|uniref:Transcriptional regulator, GntR family n=2 Tax=Methylobacterium radiotolerans TaxID=31998 RepID=B1LY62_METRJ|nr:MULTISPECIES: phosphonate metabolism transcriptional regulator PhnF [Methylobacterium]MCX7330745.1 phosphonate metabolism transcriptional regulator PhnF [Hyphomicrobiales bacterium]GAN51533.1 GntR family transcriptional regulator [Methylobacterium sp. ME121]ACB25833.1 transcriptional regulator, GntR family [Methylobacterium radiotolerans JCM 2831]KIU30644.1 transcriptional regulator [Methylobacterium radiotolerans]KTS09386.1 transcriptional regulator [Methylobacterium radiotolerans]
MDAQEQAAGLVRGEGLTAWRQIADALTAEIAAGRYAPGQQLPAEAALAARFAVNRHTVRRALAALAEGGLVRASQGRGTFVEEAPLAYPIGPRTRFSEIVAGAGREAWGDLVASATVPAGPEQAASLALAPGAPILELLTVHRADSAPLSTALTWLPLPRFAGFAEAYAERGSITRAFATCGVHDYTRLSTRIRARPADSAEAQRLDIAPGRVVLVVSSVNIDPAGVPIQANRTLFAADRVELVIGG